MKGWISFLMRRIAKCRNYFYMSKIQPKLLTKLAFLKEEYSFVIVDVETTGGDPKKDRITEIAIFRLEHGEIVDRFVSLLNPGKAIPPEITRITGINNDMVSKAPQFFEVAKRIVEITEGAVFVAHNVRFDYGFIQKEFRRLGYKFNKRLLCTVKLSREVFPQLKRYSLGKLCDHFDIPNHARHRAEGDAQATVELFQKILAIRSSDTSHKPIKQALNFTRLPPYLPSHVVENLPNKTGVYYFHNKGGDVLYVGKSTQIRTRIHSHFHSAYKQTRSIRLFEQIHDISFEVTGSELIALLREDQQIKQLHPPFNRAQRKKVFKYGVFCSIDSDSYHQFYIRLLKKGDEPLAAFSTRNQAESTLRNKIEAYQLCPKVSGIEKGKGPCFNYHLHLCQGACIQKESIATYNERVMNAVAELNFGVRGKAHFLIAAEGRHLQEKAIVWIQHSTYRGYTYIDTELCESNIKEILNSIVIHEDSRDIRRILRTYIQKHPEEIIPLTDFLPENELLP